jgi:hypothetical protein
LKLFFVDKNATFPIFLRKRSKVNTSLRHRRQYIYGRKTRLTLDERREA